MNANALRFGQKAVRRSGHDSLKNRRGAMIALIAVCLVGLMALLAFAVDGGSVQRHRRLAQNAADAGALAGAWEIYRVQNDATIFASALAEAKTNGYEHGVNGAKVVATHPVSPDHFTGDKYVKVVVTDTVQTFFAAIINKPRVIIRATAFGGIVPPSADCLVSLDPSAQHALEVKDNTTTITAHNCGIKVNSTSSTAFTNTANATFDAAGGSIGVTGNYVNAGSLNPTPTIGVAPVPDPLAYMAQPTGFSHTCDAAHSNVVINSGTVSLSAGVYCGGITVQSAATAIMGPGVYILLGGGLTVKNNNTRMNSTSPGIAFFNTWDVGPPAHPYKRIDIQSGTVVSLIADPGGQLPGVLFFQDRTVTGNAGRLAGNANNFQSGAGSTISGSLYFSTQDIEFQSGSTTTISNGGVVARRVSIHSGTNLVFTTGGGGGDNLSLRRASVVE
jgi:Flp pilus assembly protein TadG